MPKTSADGTVVEPDSTPVPSFVSENTEVEATGETFAGYSPVTSQNIVQPVSLPPPTGDYSNMTEAERQARLVGMAPGEASGLTHTKAMLEACDKVLVILPQSEPGTALKPPATPTINGVTYVVQRGVQVPVPRPIYELMVANRTVPPQNERDAMLLPPLDPPKNQRLW